MDAPFDHEAFLKYYDRRVYKLSAYSCFSILFYLPVGIVLMVIRGIILFGLFLLFNLFPCLNNNPYFVRFTSISLGIHVTLRADTGANQQEDHEIDGSSGHRLLNIYVANHINSLDYVAIKSVLSEVNYYMSDSSKARVYQAGERGVTGLVDLVSSRVVNILKSKSLKEDEDSLQNHANYPLMCFPEVIPTNGRHGLLKFDTFAFDLDSFQQEPTRIAITPVCLRMRRPFLAFNNNYFKSNDFYDVLTILFSPITIYEITFLKPELKRANESSEEFADRVQKVMAGCLSLKCSEMNYEEMRQMCTSYLHHRQLQLNRMAASRQAAENARNMDARDRRPSVHMTDLNQIRNLSIDKLALQVKEILPYVSYNTIQMHINKSSTLDIDTIIASILDSNQEEETSAEKCMFTLDAPSSSASLRDTTGATSSSSSSKANLLPTSSASKSSGVSLGSNKSPSTSSASMTPSSASASRLGSSSSSLLLSSAKKSPSNVYMSYDERKFNLINEARQRYLAKHPEYHHHSQAAL